MIIEVNSEANMKAFGAQLGALVSGGETIELVGDVGAGKTTLVKGLAKGMEVEDEVQSPSFTINRVYEARDGLILAHYDFYRLNDAGIMASELAETASGMAAVTVIEWADIVEGVLPSDRLAISISAQTETSRRIELKSGGVVSQKIIEQLA